MVNIVVEDKKYKTVSFPIIMCGLATDLIILFTDETKGIVLRENNTYEVGFYSNNWTYYLDKEKWKVFDGEITLKNV